MIFTDSQRSYVEHLVGDYFGDRITMLAPQQQDTLTALVGEIIWQEGIEALTPARLKSVTELATDHPWDGGFNTVL
ncbi:MAG TPA: hypothetical protein VD978_25355 [Azospirillum sp.]|nr:hypothetical protein [Azospirillum sp.]